MGAARAPKEKLGLLLCYFALLGLAIQQQAWLVGLGQVGGWVERKMM